MKKIVFEVGHIFYTQINKIIIFLLLVFFTGCMPEVKTDIPLETPVKNKAERQQERLRIKEVFKEINETNKTLKKSPEWLTEAYSSIKIKKLNDILKEEYSSYSKYLHSSEVYIIVHPGYYAFIQNKQPLPLWEYAKGFPQNNVVERISENLSRDDISIKVMEEQEKVLRDFIEFMSKEKKLVILILPGDYKNHLSYGYVKGYDEYARYINELTNMSESVIYMESKEYNNGFLSDKDLEVLATFLNTAGAKTIKLGGGYIGKCLSNFYESIGTRYRNNDINFILEITTISPVDMGSESNRLLNKDGRINFKRVVQYYSMLGYSSKLADSIKLRRLSMYRVYLDQ
ncbi:MAG: hypothetical protein A2X59_03165 [Nitrospirae bacterium GWC2_42_7]|nr:MAG: hypothetical protein A2X59_03165 [Nitrospirae bacterium GWC2_42_7]